jgi:hypothetical protein
VLSSEGLVGAAWDALGRGQNDRAIELAEQCVRLFEGQALAQQQALAAAPPLGAVDAATKQAILQNWALNDVATAYFIIGQAHERAVRTADARVAYGSALLLPYARTWDNAGWFWSPAVSAAERLLALGQ